MKLQEIGFTTLLILIPSGMVFTSVFPAPLRETQALAQTSDNGAVEAYRLFQQGTVQYQTSQFEAALQSWQFALTTYRKLQDREGERKALGNLGLAYRALGDYAKAIDYLQQTLDMARELKDRKGEGNALVNLGVTYRNLGDYARAIAYYQQSLDIAREIQDRSGEGNALGNLGLTYRTLGDYSKALEYLERTLNIDQEIQDRQGEGNVLGSLGNTYFSLGNYESAIEYLQQSLDIAREIQDRQEEGNALGSLGNAYSSLKNYTKAIEYYQQWLDISRAIKDRQGEGIALNNLGLVLQAAGELAAAEKTLIEGIKVRESLRAELGNNDANKVSIFETQANTYRILQQVLIDMDKTDAALEIAERGRARAFVELLTSRYSPGTAQTTIASPTVEQIKQIAKVQNSTLVQYSIVYSALYIWVIKPTGEIGFRKVNLAPLWQAQNTSLPDLVSRSRESLGVRGRGLIVVSQGNSAKQAKQLHQLYRLLIQPIADLLPTDPNAHVIFIPQESLFLVPFPALQDASGQYLIEQHTILIAPAIQVLDLTHQQHQRLGVRRNQSALKGHEALVVGNPTMPSIPPIIGEPPQQLPSLPGAEKEALAIALLLNTQALIGNQATKTAIKMLMPQARTIHLATHGLLDDVQGWGSAIALAPSGNDNGLLTAQEILDMKLNADLVVLSACDTGRGRITGDGVVGLSRSFITAGVSSVIVSLWAVPDASTTSLMTDFYQNLHPKSDKAQALRNAMLAMMKQHSQPRDWAAFILVGEAN